MIDKHKRIVKIELPLCNNKSSHFSGFIIADGLIVTCRHGFARTSDYQGKPIEIYSKEFDSSVEIKTSKNIQDLIKNETILFESKKYDIVLLKCNDAKGVFSPINLNKIESGEECKWQGGGYPYFNRDESETRGYDEFFGHVSSAVSDTSFLKLTVLKDVPKMEYWKEVSGSPVFINNQLVGIVKKQSNFKNKKGDTEVINKEIQATYLKALWNDENCAEFKKILQELQHKRKPFAYEELEKLYSNSNNEDLRKSVSTYLKTAQIVDATLALDELQIMEMCVQLKETKNTYKLLSIAMKSQYENKDWIIESDEESYINVGFRGRERLEYAMANEDKRSPLFMIHKDGNLGAGRFSLESPPESGITQKVYGDIAKEINAGKSVLITFVKRLSNTYNPDSIDDYDEMDIAGYELEDSDGSYYWRVKVTNNNITQIEEVFKVFPSIKIINIIDDPKRKIEREEKKIFKNLPDFIKGQK